MTNLSSDPHSTPDRGGIGWRPSAPPPAPAPAPTVPQQANPSAVRPDETIARLQMMQRLRDDAHPDDDHPAERDPAEAAGGTAGEMVYLRIQWAETTRYQADLYASPYATDAELYAEIANVPEEMRRTRDVADTDNTITSIIDLDDDGHPSGLEGAISASNTVSGDVDWGDLADTIDTRLAEGPDWPVLSVTLDRAAAAGYGVAANLPRLAAQDPLPAHNPGLELQYRLIADTDAALLPSLGEINTSPIGTTRRSEPAIRDDPGRSQPPDAAPSW